MANLVPVVRKDKNGKEVTRWVKPHTVHSKAQQIRAMEIAPAIKTSGSNAIYAGRRFDDIFNDADVLHFTHADCWILARDLHNLTKWDIVVIGGGDRRLPPFDTSKDFPPDGYWDHMLIRHPSGLFIDVKGIHSEQDVIEEWQNEPHYDIYRVNPKDFYGVVDGVANWGSDGKTAAMKILEALGHDA